MHDRGSSRTRRRRLSGRAPGLDRRHSPGAFAAEEGITLGDQHWTVIRFMRESYAENQITPDVRHATKHLSRAYGTGRNRIFELFPYGYVKQACKIAGMKKPRAWTTG